MSGAYWAISGLLMTLVGVILLFRYGMPYRVRTGGNSALLLEGVDQNAVRAERRYGIIGRLGLALIILGTGAQAIGTLF